MQRSKNTLSRQVPGVQSAGAASGLPLSGNAASGTVTPDSPLVRPGQYPEGDQRFITPGYFETVGTKLIAGRYFDDHDTATGARVAIIDETMAKTYWLGEEQPSIDYPAR